MGWTLQYETKEHMTVSSNGEVWRGAGLQNTAPLVHTVYPSNTFNYDEGYYDSYYFLELF